MMDKEPAKKLGTGFDFCKACVSLQRANENRDKAGRVARKLDMFACGFIIGLIASIIVIVVIAARHAG